LQWLLGCLPLNLFLTHLFPSFGTLKNHSILSKDFDVLSCFTFLQRTYPKLPDIVYFEYEFILFFVFLLSLKYRFHDNRNLICMVYCCIQEPRIVPGWSRHFGNICWIKIFFSQMSQ
jgi:hypothetical protein